jgi:hypothetical protein
MTCKIFVNIIICDIVKWIKQFQENEGNLHTSKFELKFLFVPNKILSFDWSTIPVDACIKY